MYNSKSLKKIEFTPKDDYYYAIGDDTYIISKGMNLLYKKNSKEFLFFNEQQNYYEWRKLEINLSPEFRGKLNKINKNLNQVESSQGAAANAKAAAEAKAAANAKAAVNAKAALGQAKTSSQNTSISVSLNAAARGQTRPAIVSSSAVATVPSQANSRGQTGSDSGIGLNAVSMYPSKLRAATVLGQANPRGQIKSNNASLNASATVQSQANPRGQIKSNNASLNASATVQSQANARRQNISIKASSNAEATGIGHSSKLPGPDA